MPKVIHLTSDVHRPIILVHYNIAKGRSTMRSLFEITFSGVRSIEVAGKDEVEAVERFLENNQSDCQNVQVLAVEQLEG